MANVKDDIWLQLEVCRQFQRSKCSRPDTECKFAHPQSHIGVNNGRVTACYDSIKGRCNRETPPCKYYHPPQHLKNQLLVNGKNHLALKNALKQQMPMLSAVHRTPEPAMSRLFLQQASQIQALQAYQKAAMGLPDGGLFFNPYVTGLPNFSPYMMPFLQPEAQLQLPVRAAAETQAQVFNGRKRAREEQGDEDAYSAVAQYHKRAAVDKSGTPVYQPAFTSQSLPMQLPFMQPPFTAYPPPGY